MLTLIKLAVSLRKLHKTQLQAIRIVTAVQCLGFDCSEDSFDLNTCIVNCISELCTTVPQGHDLPTICSSPNKCWEKNYSVVSFFTNGQLIAE